VFQANLGDPEFLFGDGLELGCKGDNFLPGNEGDNFWLGGEGDNF